MSEVFNGKRFGTYFLYDLKQMWRKHSKAAILIGGSIAIFYIIWVLFSLLFGHHWTTPPIEARVVMLVIAFTILELYQAHTYGYLTEKKAGSAWLMIPASRTEKFISMLLMTLVVIPLLFFAVYFLLDGFLSLVDPTYGQSVARGFYATSIRLFEGMATLGNSSPIMFTPGSFLLISFIGFCCNFLYFLLCGVCFKKNKIIMGIVILFGLSTLLSILMACFMPLGLKMAMNVDIDAESAASLMVGLMNGTMVFSALLTLGLGWGIWRRIKTLQH